MKERIIEAAIDAWVGVNLWAIRTSKCPGSSQPYPDISADEVLALNGIHWGRDRAEYLMYEREIRPRALARLREEAAA